MGERQAFFAALSKVLRVPGATVLVDPAFEDREISHGELEDGGADELRDATRCCTIRRRRREPEPVWSGAEIQGLVPSTGAEVVDLVDDQQVEENSRAGRLDATRSRTSRP
jgi:hypothetical protein